MASTSKYSPLEQSYQYIHHPSVLPSRSHHDIADEPSGSRKLQIPDFRFEQVYLKRIHQCIHTQPVEANKDEHPATADEEDSEFTSATYVSPLINPSHQVVRIDWGKIVYITMRDQVMMPLLQGMVWGVVGTYYKPAGSYLKTWLWAHLVPSSVREGQFSAWLRSWVQSMGLGSIAIGTPSLSIRPMST